MIASADGPAFTRLDPGAYRSTPWKNGGGVTVDIDDKYRPGASPGGWDGVIWRFGRTRIERAAPFSDLSGIDRLLAVIRGRGLVLRAADGSAFDVREPFRPVRFGGETPIVSELEEGPVEVLNLMATRGEAAIDLVFLTNGASRSFRPGTLVAHAPVGRAAIRVGGEDVVLEPDAALRVETSGELRVEHRDGMAALAWIGEPGAGRAWSAR